MSCQTCDDLLAAWKCSTRDYTNFVLNVSGVVGNDARPAFQEAERLARECKKTRDALMAHRCQEHGSLAQNSTLYEPACVTALRAEPGGVEAPPVGHPPAGSALA